MAKKKKKKDNLINNLNNKNASDLEIKKVDNEYLEQLKNEENNSKVDIIDQHDNDEKLDDYDNKLYVKTKKYNMIEPLIVITAVLICFLLLYKLIIVSKRTVINTLINNVSNNIIRVLDNLDSFNFNTSYNATTELTFTTSNNVLNKFQDYKYTVDASYNADYNKINGLISVKAKNNQEILNILFKALENTLYLKSTDLFYYPININLESNNITDINYQLVKEALINIKNIVINNLTYNNISKKKENITIENEIIDVKNLELNYSKDEVNNIVNNILNDMENDENLISKLVYGLNITKENLKIVFNNLRTLSKDIKVNIYTKGMLEEFVGFKLLVDNIEIFSSYILNGNNIYSFLYKDKPLKIIHDKVSNEINVYYADVSMLELSSNKLNNEDLYFDYAVNTIVDKFSGSIKFKKITDNNYKLDISFISLNNKNINADISLNIIISDYILSEEFDVNDSVNINDLSSEEYLEIIGKFLSKMTEPIFIIN